jgi:hypothetical protein
MATLVEQHAALFENSNYAVFRELRRIAFDARLCAEWMKQHWVTELPMIGPFGTLPIAKGSVVRVKDNVVVCGNDCPEGRVVQMYHRTIMVHKVVQGFVIDPAFVSTGEIVVHNQIVYWNTTNNMGEEQLRWTEAVNISLPNSVTYRARRMKRVWAVQMQNHTDNNWYKVGEPYADEALAQDAIKDLIERDKLGKEMKDATMAG